MDMPRFYFTHDYEQFKILLKENSKNKKFYKKGATIFSSEPELDFCFFIEKGLVAYSVLHDSGAQKLLFYHGEGSLFPTYKSPKKYAIGEIAYAVTDVEGFAISQTKVAQLIDQNTQLMRCVLNNYLEMFNFLIFDSINQCHNTSYMRVCNFLYLYLSTLKKSDPSTSTLYIGLAEIAQFIGVSRVQVSNVFRILREKSILDNTRGKIKIENYERLREACSPEIIF